VAIINSTNFSSFEAGNQTASRDYQSPKSLSDAAVGRVRRVENKGLSEPRILKPGLVWTLGVRQVASEVLIFIGFVALTILMTWPWARHLRDTAADTGDSYLNSWILWWDYHQTFRDPLHLFDANILYPYSYTLAFSENGYGLALFFFPLQALGLRPLTIAGIATLTASNGAAWVAGVAFAFVPYRFHNLPHLFYLFAGWLPLLLEALVLYTRSPTARRAAWLGLAFFLNGLSCIHWLVLSLIPLAVTGAFLIWSQGLWRNRSFWLRGALALGLASIALLPFLLPYLRVAKLYGLVRGPEEATLFSAHPINWLMVDWQNKFWKGMGSSVAPYQTELALFPGLLPVLLTLAHLTRANTGRVHRRALILLLDGILLAAGLAAVLVTGYGTIRLHLFGVDLIRASSPWGFLVIIGGALAARWLLAPPKFLAGARLSDLWKGVRSDQALVIGLIWAVFGFIGSFGMNFFFHRMLFKYVPLFRSIRVPARWAMICFVGLSVLAAMGAAKLVTSFRIAYRPSYKAAAFSIIVMLLLFEQRAAPLQLVRGNADPDAVTLRLKEMNMRGGIVELPAGIDHSNYLYTLRAADHAHPLVNGISGFSLPIIETIEGMSQRRPVPDRFLDLLEAIPVSYLVVHNSVLDEPSQVAIRNFIAKGEAAGRLRLVERFENEAKVDELFVVTKTEPK
jgi:hypothetical protein